jgi:hypothetical protein
MTFKLQPSTEAYFIATSGPFHSDPHGIDTFKDLKAWAEKNGINASMPVYNVFDPNGVFNTLEAQQAFQAWHDRRHLLLGKPFTLQGENDLAVAHVDELFKAGVNFRDVAAIYFLIFGRNLYYYSHGRIAVGNVTQFVEDAFKNGVVAASAA